MANDSDHLKQLFDSLGIAEDPLFEEENELVPVLQINQDDGKERTSEDDWCDSLTLEDYEAIKDYGTTPPRTERSRKQKERNAYCSQAVEAAKAFNTRNKKSASRCASLPLNSSNSGTARGSFRQRKRSQDLQRSYERQRKMQIEEVSPADEASEEVEPAASSNGSRSESLPPICLAVKVFQRARYLSVSSRRVGSGKNFSRKTSTADMPPDRVSFHALMSGLLTNTPQDPNLQAKSRSEEEVLYQQEINEMLWLELQAWHACQDTLAYDNQLIENRRMVAQVYEEVMKFDFHRIFTLKGAKSSPCKMSCGECRFPSSCGNPVLYEPCDFCFGCLSIWCENCREKESAALEHVWQLLERISKARSLFPSSRKLVQFSPSWAEKEFISRHNALCLWFNTTSQLRLITDLLGRRLGHISSDSIPWPSFPSMKAIPKSPASTYSRDSGNISVEETYDTGQKTAQVHAKPHNTPVVRFEIEDSDEGLTSSEPGQSYESDLTSGSSGSLNLLKNPHDAISDNDEGRTTSRDQLFPPPTLGLRRSSSDIFLQANPYRSYVENLLRNKGMKKTLDKVEEVIGDVMSRTICIIEESHHLVKIKKDANLPPAESTCRLVMPPLAALQEELRQVEGWTALFDLMGLPRFHTLFLFLASIPMHMMRECLKLRLEQMPSKPSQLSIKQLMIEYKEAIRFSVYVRQKYLKWCSLLQADLPQVLSNNVEDRRSQAVEELDTNVKRMLEVYLDWLDQFILMLHRQPNQSGLQRTFLQEEWRFVQATCPSVTGVESLVASRFCNMACNMLCSVGKFLDTGLEDISVSSDNSFESDDAFLLDSDQVPEAEDEQDAKRKKLVQLCRTIQDLLSEARERSLRAIAFAKMLRKDLEVSVEGSVACLEDMMPRLQEMGLVLVKGHNAHGKLAFVPAHMSENHEDIVDLFQMQFGTTEADACDTPPHHYLILVSLPLNSSYHWDGPVIDLALLTDCGITFSKNQVSGCLLIAKNACNLGYIKAKLTNGLGDAVKFCLDYVSPDKDVTNALLDMKTEALDMCKYLETSIEEAQRLVSTEHVSVTGEEDYRQISHLVRDTVHQGYLLGFDYHKEVMRLVSGRQRESLAPLLSSFARSWIMFVKTHYSPGRGTRPRWALPGLEFLLFVCDPHVTSLLTDTEFKKLRLEVENAREYIIGSAVNSGSSTPSTPGGLGSRPFRHQLSYQSSSSDAGSSNLIDSPRIRSQLLKFSQRSMDRSHDEADESPIERVRHAIEELESEIEEQRLSDKLIGRVTEYHRDPIEIKPHNVSFSWQRGFKIGTGRFAKVYTAVNNSSGELLAMKVLPLHPNDHRSIKKVTSELHTFERIRHSHLVKYYGVEIHKDEMRIFMEYCDEGTLEALASSTEGLPEEIVRKYTRQLLSAVHKLHSNGIVHRDIKGANIFLAKENNILKLGDFGCAVRLRSHHTEVGELSGIVGTHAYMAPEIFGSNTGHGRAADIWSVGCVVIEMVTGKRPWPQYDSSVQIMFQVGSGKSPTIPESLSEEGQDFLNLCFVHDPKERATAAKLLDHTFVKVEDDESSSIPLFPSSLSPVKAYVKFR